MAPLVRKAAHRASARLPPRPDASVTAGGRRPSPGLDAAAGLRRMRLPSQRGSYTAMRTASLQARFQHLQGRGLTVERHRLTLSSKSTRPNLDQRLHITQESVAADVEQDIHAAARGAAPGLQAWRFGVMCCHLSMRGRCAWKSTCAEPANQVRHRMRAAGCSPSPEGSQAACLGPGRPEERLQVQAQPGVGHGLEQSQLEACSQL